MEKCVSTVVSKPWKKPGPSVYHPMCPLKNTTTVMENEVIARLDTEIEESKPCWKPNIIFTNFFFVAINRILDKSATRETVNANDEGEHTPDFLDVKNAFSFAPCDVVTRMVGEKDLFIPHKWGVEHQRRKAGHLGKCTPGICTGLHSIGFHARWCPCAGPIKASQMCIIRRWLRFGGHHLKKDVLQDGVVSTQRSGSKSVTPEKSNADRLSGKTNAKEWTSDWARNSPTLRRHLSI